MEEQPGTFFLFPVRYRLSGEEGKMEKTGCKVICGASATLAVKGLMMMMMMMTAEARNKGLFC